MRAAEAPGSASRHALAELYQIYWYPLYAYARRRGADPDAAADLIQGFFVSLVEGAVLRTADQSKGRFRSYLLGALKHYMRNEWEKSRAIKRGGARCVVSINADAEQRYGSEPSHGLTPERLYERQWALTLLHNVMNELQGDYASAGKQKLFDDLKDLIAGPLPNRSYAEIGETLGMSEGALKVAVHRLRQRYREVLVNQIAETVSSHEEVEDEIRHLHAALAGLV